MAAIFNKDYKDAPAVFTELVKFLSMNTSVDVVDRLVDQVQDIKANLSNLTKKFNSVDKEAVIQQ